jgi:transposase
MEQPPLFDIPAAEEEAASSALGGKPRLKRANRSQVEMQLVALDQLVAVDHRVRVVWDFVEQLDLSRLYAQVKAVEGQAGQSAIDARILLGLWLYATLEGVGSARALDRLCTEHIIYRWLCGGVSVNYHTLADFRVQHGDLLDEILTNSIAALLAEGLVDLERVAQDGLRVRASAGSNSFHRRTTLESYLETAQAQVEQLKQEVENHPEGTSQRQRAARERAVHERTARVEQALKRLNELEAKKPNKKQSRRQRRREVRTSPTDPDAHIMKMADGGYRPAYNVQLCADTATQLIVGVEVVNAGNDVGQVAPMLQQLEHRCACLPQEYLADGGFTTVDDLEWLHQKRVVSYLPVKPSRKPGVDPYQSKPTDTPAIAQWRQRMASQDGKQIYKLRAATIECVNAIQRNRGLQAFRVRGLPKVRTVLLWFVLAHNLLRAQALRLARTAAS